MTQQAVIADAGPANTGDARLDSRAEALVAKMSGARAAEAKAAPPEAGDPDFQAPATLGKAPKLAVATSGDDDAEATPAAEPAVKQLDKIALLERENRRTKETLAKEKREFQAEQTRIQARAKELDHLASIWDNPDRLIEELAKRVPPEKLIKYFEDEADPARRMARTAEEKAKKELSPLEERLRALEEKEKRLNAQESQSKAEAIFSDRIKAVAADAPLAARLLERKPSKVLRRADALVDYYSKPVEQGGRGLRFGEDYTFDNVIAQIEADLKEEAEDLADRAATETAADDEAETPTQPQTPSSKSAAAKAKTINNRLASDRTTLDKGNSATKAGWDDKIKRAERLARRAT